MIYDTLENAGIYSGVDTRIAKGLEILRNTDFAVLADGHYEIDDDVYYNIMSYDEGTAGVLEAHDKYADIQMVFEGEEYMGIAKRDGLTEKEFKPENDIHFYSDTDKDVVVLGGDRFMVIFPQDAHAPGMAKYENMHIRRVCMKVKLV